MADEHFLIKILDKLGFNTTKLRWKMYQWERRAHQAKASGGLPPWLQWMRYEHKICRHCGAVNDRQSRTCHRCERRIPSVIVYRLMRVGGLLFPESAPVTGTAFIVIITIFFGAMLTVDGMDALWAPTHASFLLFGAFLSELGPGGLVWWRWFGFSFAHAGLIHIGFNVYATMQIAPLIESSIGRIKMLVVITVCQATAAFGTYAWYEIFLDRRFFTFGASGWVFGLIGFGAAYFHRMGPAGKTYRDALMRWVIIGIIFGVVIRANNAAHIGGMLGGAVMAYLPEARGHKKVRAAESLWKIAASISLVIWILTIVKVGLYAARNLDTLGG